MPPRIDATWVKPRLALGGLAPIAANAVELAAEPAVAALGRHGPRPELKRRLVPDVLAVAARELGDPVTGVVPMEPDDRALHRRHRTAATAGRTLPAGSSTSIGRARAASRAIVFRA